MMVRPWSAHLFHNAFDSLQHLGKEAGKRLVEQVRVDIQRHGTADLQQLALAVGQIQGQVPPLLPHPDILQETLGLLAMAGLCPFQQGGEETPVGQGPP